MNSPIDISIIIPVYNCEKYLDTCINSLLHQKGVNHELIFINDGSTDNCASIIAGYMKGHTNIVLINKENGGASSARNRGLAVAKGRYVMFVDSDDTIVENSLARILHEAEESNADVMQLTHYICSENHETKVRRLHSVSTCMDGVSYLKLMQRRRTLVSATHAHMLKTEYMLSLPFRFDESLARCEDLEYFTKAILKAKRVRNYTDPYYNYNLFTTIGGNDMRRNRQLVFNCYYKIRQSFHNFVSTENFGDNIRRILDYLICTHVYGYSPDVFRLLTPEQRSYWIPFIKRNMFRNYGWMRPWLYLKYFKLTRLQHSCPTN